MCFDTECHIDFKGSKYAFSGPSGVIWWNLYERYLIKFLLAKMVFPPFGVPFRLKRLAFNICLITSAQAKMHSYSQTAISFGRNIGLDIIKQEDFTRVPTLDLWKSLQITQNVKLTPSCSLHSNYCICVFFFFKPPILFTFFFQPLPYPPKYALWVYNHAIDIYK